MKRRLPIVAAIVAALAVVTLVVVTRHDSSRVVTGGSPTSTSFSTTSTVTGSSSDRSTSSTPATPNTAVPSSPPTTTTAPAGPAVAIRRGDPSRRTVALTFDAGSDLGHANDILDFLGAQGIKATFGMTGQFADAHPDVVRRIVRDGHQLLNHSYNHPSFTGRSTGTAPLSRAGRLDQLARADAAIQSASGTSSLPWFRPPYGDEDASVRADVALAGYRYEVLWTVDSLGWKGLDPATVAQRCIGNADNGAIFLLHVGSASTDWSALPAIVYGLRAAGYSFNTVAGVL